MLNRGGAARLSFTYYNNENEMYYNNKNGVYYNNENGGDCNNGNEML